MSLHILIVDDDEKSRRLASDVLEHRGYVITRACSGEEALELAQDTVYDLTLLDIQLPGRNGVETFKALRRLPGWGQVPVIAMTASVMPDDRSSLLCIGFHAFCSKPVGIKDLVRRVDEVLSVARG